MWLIRIKTLKSSLTSFFHNPHPIYEHIFLAVPSRYAIYMTHLSHLKYCHILPGQTAALASLIGLCLQTFPSHQFNSLFSPNILIPSDPYNRPTWSDLSSYSYSSAYYAVITLVFSLLLPYVKHVLTSSPIQLPYPQPRETSLETQSWPISSFYLVICSKAIFPESLFPALLSKTASLSFCVPLPVMLQHTVKQGPIQE